MRAHLRLRASPGATGSQLLGMPGVQLATTVLEGRPARMQPIAGAAVPMSAPGKSSLGALGQVPAGRRPPGAARLLFVILDVSVRLLPLDREL